MIVIRARTLRVASYHAEPREGLADVSLGKRVKIFQLLVSILNLQSNYKKRCGDDDSGEGKDAVGGEWFSALQEHKEAVFNTYLFMVQRRDNEFLFLFLNGHSYY